MCNIWFKYKSVILLVSSLFFMCSCTTFVEKKDDNKLMTLEEISLKKPVLLSLKSTKGAREKIRIYTEILSRRHLGSQTLKPTREKVSFLVQVDNLGFISKNKIAQSTRILKQQGKANLHDYAYPNLGEVFTYYYKTDGEVVKVENFPKDSVFYIPSISLPKMKVEKGDTWTLKTSWLNRETEVKLHLDMITILKKFVQCGGGQICAVLAISGETTVPALEEDPNAGFLGRLKGTILFSLDKGHVVSVDIVSEETLQAGEGLIEIHSCLKSTQVINEKSSFKPCRVSL